MTTYTCTCMHTHMHINMHTHVHTHTHTHMHTHTYTHMHTHMHTHIHTHTHAHTHTCKQIKANRGVCTILQFKLKPYTSVQVQMEAFKATVAFITQLESAQLRGKFIDMIPLLLAVSQCMYIPFYFTGRVKAVLPSLRPATYIHHRGPERGINAYSFTVELTIQDTLK